MSVQAATILSARAKLEDAMWEPALRAKARRPSLYISFFIAVLTSSRCHTDWRFAASPCDGDCHGQGARQGTYDCSNAIGSDAYPQRRCLVSRSSSRLLSTRTFSTRRRSDAMARCSGTTRCLGCSLASTKSERRCIRGILRCWCVQSSRNSTPSACVLTLLCCRSRRGLGRGCGPLALISPHAALGLTGTPLAAP